MQRKPSKRRPAKQPKPRQQKGPTEAEKAALKAEIARIRERAKKEIAAAQERIARDAQRERENRAREKAAKKRERERAAKVLERAGLFEPAKYKTKAAKTRRVKTLAQQFRDFLNPKTTVFIPTKSKRASTKARARAKELGITTTPRGFFFPREGAKSVKLRYDKKRGEYAVETERVEKSGKTGRRRRITRAYPIEPLQSADDKLAALKANADRLLGPKRRSTDRLAFTVEGPHRGRSKMTYETPELLVRDLERRYDKSQHAPAHMKGKMKSQFLGFLELVAVQKTTAMAWTNENIRQRRERERNAEKRKRAKRNKRR